MKLGGNFFIFSFPQRVWVIAIALSLFIFSCQSPTPTGKNATIRRVISGNSLEVLISDRNPPQAQTVRLRGVDAPQLYQEPWGKAAQDYLATRLPPQTAVLLEIDASQTDPYNRLWAYVWQDSELIDEAILKEGWGLTPAIAPHSPYQTRLDRAQNYARILGYGIWNPQQPLRQTPSQAVKPQSK
ncbi:MAG: thermonuclease family protein [Jaaginema sp. PMC 1079.18]|nr:thermonuclease family protein [Jaaginema sp. PMC 1080.18]MEC4850345.1 thermonuclease family protein [Jaaginema sp. PMC 1079.18]MEC4867143.1 thermonuclease family protein [Jaaginema sp. PMC 1078.18]